MKEKGRTTQSSRLGAGGPGEGVRDGGIEGTRGTDRKLPRTGTHLNCILKEKEALGKRRTFQKGRIL